MIEQSNVQIERRIKLANTSQQDKLDNIRNQLNRIERKREPLDNWLTSMEKILRDTERLYRRQSWKEVDVVSWTHWIPVSTTQQQHKNWL
jgi:hypothetical protein